MSRRPVGKPSAPATVGAASCCKVEAVVGVDDRGQMVLPKEVRDRAGIRAGDKLALVAWEQGGRVCCLGLIKVDDLAGMVRTMLGPVMASALEGEKGGV